MLLNDDAFLGAGDVTAIRSAFGAHELVGIVAPVVVYEDDHDRIQDAGMMMDTRLGRVRVLGGGRRLARMPARPYEVDAVKGCAMAVRRTVFERVGGLDDRYFFSHEDIEFCLRARTHGFRSMVTPAAVVPHRLSRAAGGRSAVTLYYEARNRIMLVRRYGGFWTVWLFPWSFSVNVARRLWWIARAPSWPVRKNLAGALFRGIGDGLRGRLGKSGSADRSVPPA
ncbi:glycosyltransferase family 2 protein, partial [bacterium]|nr:glycosyltransferase family 2 protein [candidate division CSSED10-310 bacterium]